MDAEQIAMIQARATIAAGLLQSGAITMGSIFLSENLPDMKASDEMLRLKAAVDAVMGVVVHKPLD